MEIEENLNQEELENEENQPTSPPTGGEDKPEEVKKSADSSGNQSGRESEMSKQPKNKMGVMLTVFAATIIILVGGLASYYYYNFQSQGLASGKVLENVWDETVLVSVELTNHFKQIDTFDNLGDSGRDSFESLVNDANRTIRDGIFDINGQTGLSISSSTFASKLNGFLDDYSNMLQELKRIIARVEDIDDVDELDQFLAYGDDMEKSYDEMLLVGNDHVQANLPRVIFNMPTDVESMLEEKIEEHGTQEDQNKAERQAVEQVVSKFASAWLTRDSEAMQTLLTSGARASDADKIALLMEDSSDVEDFRILNTTLEDTSAVINGSLKKITPDDTSVTETWKFTLLKTGDDWLIDSWIQQ